MSSVGSSDSSNPNRSDEVVRRNREDYRKNESEMVKKHKQELRRITEQHYQEMENLKNSHQRQMEDLQKQSTDAISKRDHKHQQSIEGMREMHIKQLKQTADENQRREESLRKSTTGDANQQKAQNDARFERLSEDFRSNMSKQEAERKRFAQESREAQQTAIQQNRERLERAYESQLGAVKDERNEKVKHLQNQFTNYRENAEGRLKGQELRHMQDQDRASDTLLRTVGKERQARVDSEQILRDGFDDGMDTMKSRYEKAMKKERDAQSMVSRNLKSNAVDRIDNQVRRLEQEKADLKDANVRQALLLKHQQRQEINNIRDSWGKNIENFREQRDEAVRQSNQRNQKDVAEVRDELSKQITENNRFYRGKMDEQGRIHRMAHENLVGDFEARTEHTQQSADHRVKTIVEKTEEEKQRLIKQQNENHVIGQRQRQDEVKAIRAELELEKQQAINRMHDQIRKQEVQHVERMNQVVAKYEKQLQSLQDQVLKERKTGEENLKRTVDELQRAHKISLDQVESKNRDKLRQMTNSQTEEIRSVNRRHEEKLDQVLAEVKKT